MCLCTAVAGRYCHTCKPRLHRAAEKGNLNNVIKFLEKGDGINSEDVYGNTPLRMASKNGHFELVRFLVEKGALLNKHSNARRSPLSGAAFSGHVERARFLLENGAERDKQDVLGHTPFWLAASAGHFEMCKMLLEYGADYEIEDNKYRTPFEVTYANIQQLIRDEPRRLLDAAPCRKRCVDDNQHFSAASTEDEEAAQGNKRQCVSAEEGKVDSVH